MQASFSVPYATEYNSTETPDIPIQGITNTYGASTYYAHENGTDQVKGSGTTSIDSFINLEITILQTLETLQISEEMVNSLCLLKDLYLILKCCK